MKESDIEKQIGEYAKKSDCIYRKFTCPGKRNVSDRLIITPHGVTGYLEVKKPGGEVRSGQVREGRMLHRRGVPTAIVDNVIDGKRFIDSLCRFRLMDYNEPGDRYIDKLFDD